MTGPSLTGMLRERASLQPDDIAFTFIDYEQDWEGVANTLTWAQLNRRVLSLASELRLHASIGDRAVVLAPQGLDYVVAFLGSMQAGLIAVPLSVPMVGIHDERVTAVLRDSSPRVIVTTSSVAGHVAEYAVPQGDDLAPVVLEVDSLDLDSRRRSTSSRETPPETAYLQYTSGSTRTPAGVMVSNRNLAANFEQIVGGLFPDYGKVSPPNTSAVSWLPFYHDMGLMLGLCGPILGGWHSVFTTPMSFLARPARWMQLLASNPRALTAAPNFAFELAAARTSDDDMAGLDLGDVLNVLSGSERVHEATLRRFAQRFARFNLRERALRPSYGLAEATLFVATREPGQPPNIVCFEPENLSGGHAKRCENRTGTSLVSYGNVESPVLRIVDPETKSECPGATIGEIWLHGDNVCLGYWQKPEQTEYTFEANIVAPSAGTPDGSWLRTGDLGFIFEGELFIVGRIKDLLIVRGRNHYPDDIEATIQEITGGRVAAIAVEQDRTEQLVAIVEVRTRAESDEVAMEKLRTAKREVTSAISQAHGISAADVVLVGRGSIPITTSGKIRRASCVDLYRNRQFVRLDDQAVNAG
ncbi:MAG: acyl-CoA synthetase [Mycobacterium sp.]|jgi:fatty acid CoA ligase FadD28|nr:acyl-CoA synthetase [Mycobacterium sp.]